MLEDFPRRVADFLEGVATRIRGLTVDRVARVITFITLGLVALTMVVVSVFFLLIGLLRIAGELVHKACDCTMANEIAYAAIGGLFLLAGVLLWSRRTRNPEAGSES